MSEVLRIGAFFDGTGNNIWNDEAIEDYSKDVAIKEAIITELSAHNENLNSIIEMLIRNS